MNFIVHLLAQAQPSPPTQTDLRPALYAAGGTLLGVFLTAVFQLLNSRVQRRHDNQGRAFDMRFELYVGVFSNLEGWLKEKAAVDKELDDDEITSLDAARDLVDKRRADLASATAEVDQYIAKGSVPEARRQELLKLLESAPGELSQANAQAEEAAKKAAARMARARRHYRKVVKYNRSLQAQAKQLNILSEESTMAALNPVFNDVFSGVKPSPGKQLAFRDEVRRELGIERRSRTGLWVRRRLRSLLTSLILLDRNAIEFCVPALRHQREERERAENSDLTDHEAP